MTFQRAIVRNERLFVPSGSRLVVGASSFQRCIFGSTIVCRCIKRPVSQPTIYFRWRIEARRWRWRCSIAGEIQPREPRRPSPLLFPSPASPAAPLPRVGKCVTRRRSAITPSFSSLLPFLAPFASRVSTGESKNYTLPGHRITNSFSSLAATRF